VVSESISGEMGGGMVLLRLEETGKMVISERGSSVRVFANRKDRFISEKGVAIRVDLLLIIHRKEILGKKGSASLGSRQ